MGALGDRDGVHHRQPGRVDRLGADRTPAGPLRRAGGGSGFGDAGHRGAAGPCGHAGGLAVLGAVRAWPDGGARRCEPRRHGCAGQLVHPQARPGALVHDRGSAGGAGTRTAGNRDTAHTRLLVAARLPCARGDGVPLRRSPRLAVHPAEAGGLRTAAGWGEGTRRGSCLRRNDDQWGRNDDQVGQERRPTSGAGTTVGQERRPVGQERRPMVQERRPVGQERRTERCRSRWQRRSAHRPSGC